MSYDLNKLGNGSNRKCRKSETPGSLYIPRYIRLLQPTLGFLTSHISLRPIACYVVHSWIRWTYTSILFELIHWPSLLSLLMLWRINKTCNQTLKWVSESMRTEGRYISDNALNFNPSWTNQKYSNLDVANLTRVAAVIVLKGTMNELIMKEVVMKCSLTADIDARDCIICTC